MLETGTVEPPDIQYTRSGDLSIAYQIVGDGPVDLVFVPFIISPTFSWMHPLFVTFFERLASFSRLILLDKRGTGASDRPRTPPTLEARMDDLRVVLDAVGAEQAALFGTAHGAQMCALFAATYPERTAALVLYNCWARLPGTEDEHRSMVRNARATWERREEADRGRRADYPSLADDETFHRTMDIIGRASASPGSAAEFFRTAAEADITAVLPTIRAPTLLLYRRDLKREHETLAGRDQETRTRELAAAIPNARVVAVPGEDLAPFVGDEIP